MSKEITPFNTEEVKPMSSPLCCWEMQALLDKGDNEDAEVAMPEAQAERGNSNPQQ